MVNPSHPYNSYISDMELYDEARLLDHESYVEVPYVRMATDLME